MSLLSSSAVLPQPPQPQPQPQLKPLPPVNYRKRGVEILAATGWRRSMPGEERKLQVKPSDVFPVFSLPGDWADYLVRDVALGLGVGAISVTEAVSRKSADLPSKMDFVTGLAWSGALWRYGNAPCRVLLGAGVGEMEVAEMGKLGEMGETREMGEMAELEDPQEMAELGKLVPEAVVKRLEHELAVVTEVGYADYFLIVWDICCFAAREGIPFLARGSAADSLLCYVLGISTVCPLRFNLYFERFLNPERMKFSKLADIDLDFPWDQRDTVMEYVFERWGRDHVAMIGGFSRYQARGAAADIGKAFGLSEVEARKFTKLLPWVGADRIADALSDNVRLREIPTHEAPYPDIIAMAKHLTDLPRHTMMHPCGIVISREKLCRLVPLMPSGRGPQMTHFDMDAVEDLGLVKIDLLGQAGLSVLRDVLRQVRLRHGVAVDLDKLSWEDAQTWEMVATGAARGVHHIESPAMTSLLVQSNCRDMDCLCAIVSVIRPGAADESKKLLFTRRHQGFAPVDYPHPSLEPYLKDTYGLLVFEEHILMVAHHFAGMNLGRSDVLRRELVKMKSPEKLIALGHEFRDCARELGRSDADTEKVWRALVAFHGYMFNKAHSASYAVEAFQGAWLKARFPALYMAAVLSHERGFYTPLFYSLEVRRLGLRLLLPDINEPSASFVADAAETAIRIPLRYIQGLTQETRRLWEAELQRGVFTCLENFARRVAPQESEISLLVESGALDSLATELNRPELFWELKELRRAGAFGMDGLFANQKVATSQSRGLHLPLQAPTARAMAVREWELFGFPVTQDPWEVLGPEIDWGKFARIGELAKFQKKLVRLCGLVIQSRRNHTQRGEIMQFFTLADRSGFIECTVFPDIYRRCGHFVRLNQLIEVRALVEPFDNLRGQTLEVKSVRLTEVGKG